ncbi:Cyanate hydratase, partial [Grifola frondosa]
ALRPNQQSNSNRRVFLTQKLNASSEPYADLPPICAALFEAKARKGLTFDAIAKAIGRDEVWVAAMFYGQAKLSSEELVKLSEVLELPQGNLHEEIGENWFPHRGIGPMPPTDPVLYRLYEGVLVYGNAIKVVLINYIYLGAVTVHIIACIQFGDGIMSMIDCKVNVERKPDPKGDRVLLTFECASDVSCIIHYIPVLIGLYFPAGSSCLSEMVILMWRHKSKRFVSLYGIISVRLLAKTTMIGEHLAMY